MTPTRTLALLLSLFALRGIALLCVLPPGEMWDEYSHLAYVDHWAQTAAPAVYGRTAVDPAFLAALVRVPQPPPVPFGRTYADFWAARGGRAVPASLPLYEAQHPFLYYALAAPVYRACGGRSDLPAAVAALRSINLGCGAVALLLILRWLARATPDAAVLLLLGSWVALQPLLLLNVVRVANDAMAFLLGTAVVVTALDLRRPGFRPRLLALAVLLPLAVLAKATNAALVPVVVIAVATARRPAVGLLIVGVVTAAVLAPYVAGNLHTFGVVTPMQEAVANHRAGRSTWAVLTAAPPWRWPAWAASWWVVDGLWVGGWSFLQPPRLLEAAYAAAVATAATAAVVRWRRLPLPAGSRWLAVAVVACTHLGLMWHAAQSYAAWDGRVLTNPWYAAVALPWWLILLGCGGLALPRQPRRWVMLGVPAVFVAAEAFGVFWRMVPAYYDAPPSVLALRRMASVHPAALGPPTAIGCGVATVAVLVVLARSAVGRTGPGPTPSPNAIARPAPSPGPPGEGWGESARQTAWSAKTP